MSGAVVEPVSGIVKSMTWDLADVIAYLLLGVLTAFVVLAAFYGADRVATFVEQNPVLAIVASVLFGYPTGAVVLAVGRLVREAVQNVAKGAPRPSTGDAYADLLTTHAGLDSVLGAVGLPPTSQSRVAVLLAEKFIPGAAAGLRRQASMFRFFVTLVGASALSALALELGAILRWRSTVPGNAVPYAFWGLIPLGTLLLAEHTARRQNTTLVEMMGEATVAVAALMRAEAGRAGAGKPH